MVEAGFVAEADGLLQPGPAMEAEFGRSHYRDLLASFSSSPLLLGRHGAHEIGYIDPTVLVAGEGAQRILLGGRSWLVTNVEWSRSTAWLEPVKEGGKARWTGSARTVGPEICEGVREVLGGELPPAAQLSRRARMHLESLQEEIPSAKWSRQAGAGTAVRWWTFAGTILNRRLARQVGGTARSFDALSINGDRVIDLHRVETQQPLVALTPDERVDFSRSMKFASCLPPQLLDRTVMARVFDELCTNGEERGGGTKTVFHGL